MKQKHLLVCAAICALILAAPVFADNHEEGEGDAPDFFVMVEGAFTKASGPGGTYSLLQPNSDGQPQGMIQAADLDESFAPRVSFGWNAGNGWWALSWSQWDDENDSSVSASDPSYVWDTLYHSDEAWDNFEGTASALRTVEASTIDLTYGRKVFGDDNFSGRWMFGLRQASLDHMLNTTYADLFDELHHVDLASEASGIGFVGGVSGSYNLNEKWFVTGGFQYSFLTGEVEAMSYMEATDVLGSFVDVDADVMSEEDRTFSIMTASASLVWHPTDSTYYWIGYELSQWENVVDTHLFPDDVSEGFIQTDTTGINFDGFKFGLGFTF
jgi:hypothetical protein